ncbi:MAG TPA: glucans biosynthesis glucosyltransferase MdoH [Acetobacteraceae bacterium]|nr:glucans biosynthesis glucosyltransferase MdoH [Acetobacteraceae bacterium]
MDAVLNPAATGESISALPDEAPLPMPRQSLRQTTRRTHRLTSAPRAIGLRRLLVIGSAVALTVAGVHEMYLVLAARGVTALAIVMLALFVPLFAWVALSFTSALAGFGVMLAGGGRRLLPRTPSLPATRTALLMPTYNESPHLVMAGLQAIWESLQAAGAGEKFDAFILSDTTDPDIWIAEEAAFLALCSRTGAGARIFYRHRPHNTARKAGNIADWVTRFGAAYPQFLILDADSVMEASALLALVNAMEAHADVGLIQTLPIVTGGNTLFARMQQFAGRVYGPLIAQGIAWWHGAEGNYWGHNALIRTHAFAEHAGLPELRGRKPFGGHILSHDFVEAALIRRGGWAVHMVPALPGSYEGAPPSLIDLSVRDRRWCQGNLQHAAVLPARGLHWINRLHLLTGIGSYVTAPLWLAFLLCGILIAIQARFVPPDYFPAGRSLFPRWPVIDPVRAMWVFVGTMGLLLIPKLLGSLIVLLHAPQRRGCGGALRMLASVVLETLIAGLAAPVVMLTQCMHVTTILLGRDSGWNAQRRDDGSMPARQIVRAYWQHTALGLALGAAAWAVTIYLALWMLPVVLGLALAIPLAAVTARRSTGEALRRAGLLLIPEERGPPAVVQRAASLAREAEAAVQPVPAIPRLLRDAGLLAAHRRMLPPPRRPRLDPIDPVLLVTRLKLQEAESLAGVLHDLTRAEMLVALGDEVCLDRIVAQATATKRLR